MVKAAYFRVAMDTGVGGCVGPIFDDSKFEYIPIPDDFPTDDKYSNCLGRSGNFLSTYLPKKLHNKFIHYDPDFRNTPVYGDNTSHQTRYLDLVEKDLLVFYAGLAEWTKNKSSGIIDLYIIGYFIVEEAIAVDLSNVLDVPKNAHSLRYIYEKNILDENELEFEYVSEFTLVTGKPSSRLLDKAIQISYRGTNKRGSLENRVNDEWAKILGIPKGLSLQRKNLRWVPHRVTGKGDVDALMDRLGIEKKDLL